MCLGVPMRIIEINGFNARCEARGIERKASLTCTHSLVSILLRDPEPILLHQEIVLRDGKTVGYVRAGSFGHTLGAGIGLAMVEGAPCDADYLASGEWAVEIAGRVYPAEVSLKPFYDPDMTRIRC